MTFQRGRGESCLSSRDAELTISNLKIKQDYVRNRSAIIITVVEANLSEKKLLLFFFFSLSLSFSLERATPANIIPKL